jgi:transcriptional regulator with XRE-family HTH domain
MAMLTGSLPPRMPRAAQPAMSRLEAGGVIPTIPLLDRISAALDVDLIVQIAPHAA